MSKHDDPKNHVPKNSFSKAALLLEPSMIAIACHLARIAAEKDYKAFLMDSPIPYNGPEPKGGPQ